MSHEFRTPLGTALMFIDELLEEEEVSYAVMELLELIKCTLCLLLSLVDNMMDLKLIRER